MMAATIRLLTLVIILGLPTFSADCREWLARTGMRGIQRYGNEATLNAGLVAEGMDTGFETRGEPGEFKE